MSGFSVNTQNIMKQKAIILAAMAVSSFFAPASSDWISVAEPRAGARSAGVVAKAFVNGGDVKSASWTVSGLGVFTCYANGDEVGAQDVLKPGFTYKEKRRNSFEYDVTALLKRGVGETNVLAAVLTSGWWSDGILGKTGGKENAFRGELRLEYANGSVEVVATDESSAGFSRARPESRQERTLDTTSSFWRRIRTGGRARSGRRTGRTRGRSSPPGATKATRAYGNTRYRKAHPQW